jgi:hypothetical protein
LDLAGLVERGVRATVSMLISLILWYLIPSVILQGVPSPISTLSESSFLIFAIIIGGLSALNYALDGRPLGLVCGMGSNLATALFLYLATNGGVLTFQQGSIAVTADFTPLLYLLIAPSVLSMVKKAWEALSESVGRQSEWKETL